MGIYDIIHYLGIICGYQYDMTGLYICECFVKLSSNTSYDDSMVKPNEKNIYIYIHIHTTLFLCSESNCYHETTQNKRDISSDDDTNGYDNNQQSAKSNDGIIWTIQ